MSNKIWMCRRCGEKVNMIEKRCGCAVSPSPWELVDIDDSYCECEYEADGGACLNCGKTDSEKLFALWKKSNIPLREELPLLTNRHITKAQEDLGVVYRVKTDLPNEYPEIGCVEVQNAVRLLSNAYADLEHCKNIK